MFDEARAKALFRSFQGREPKADELAELAGGGGVGLAVGQVIGLSYRALGNGKDYYHDFAAPLPRLFVSADGRQVYFVGGGYRFSPRGFLK